MTDKKEKKKIFIVEDNDLNLKLFCDLLKASDYEVEFTKNGFEAISSILKFMPDLILMDIQLHGVSGMDIIKNIKGHEKLKNIPVIAITAFAMKDDKEKILEAGCEGYMSKPIAIKEFLQKVDTLLNR